MLLCLILQLSDFKSCWRRVRLALSVLSCVICYLLLHLLSLTPFLSLRPTLSFSSTSILSFFPLLLSSLHTPLSHSPTFLLTPHFSFPLASIPLLYPSLILPLPFPLPLPPFPLPPSPLFLTGELGIFCPFMTPSHKPHLALSKSKRLIKVTSATAGDTEKGTGMASGVLCLVRALILHELDRITAWGEECLSAVPEQTRFVYRFSIIFVIFRVIKIL